jgi:hypothetical protein
MLSVALGCLYRWRETLPDASTLDPMRTKREVVSYALRRRATLASLRNPRSTVSRSDVCDADPMLIRSAMHHGSPASEPCPVCGRDQMRTLNYVFGDQLGQYSGRIKSEQDLAEMEDEYGEFKVYVVEVCPRCGWNYLIMSYLLGDGVQRRPPRHRQTVEDIYG